MSPTSTILLLFMLAALVSGCTPSLEEFAQARMPQEIAVGTQREEVNKLIPPEAVLVDDGRFLIAKFDDISVLSAVWAGLLIEFDAKGKVVRVEKRGVERQGLSSPILYRGLDDSTHGVVAKKRVILQESGELLSRGFQFTRQERWIASTDRKRLEFWDPRSGLLVKSVDDAIPIASRQVPLLSKQMPALAAYAKARGNQVTIFDADSGQRVAALVGATMDHGFALSSDGTRIAQAQMPELVAWSLPSGERIATYSEHKVTYGWLNRRDWGWIAFSPDGRLVASEVGWSEGTHLWELATAKTVTTLGRSTGFPQFFPDGSLLSYEDCLGTSVKERTYRLVDGSGSLLRSWSMKCTAFMTYAMFLMASDCNLFVALAQGYARVWERKSGEHQERCTGLVQQAFDNVPSDQAYLLPEIGGVSDTFLSPDGRLAVSGSFGAAAIDLRAKRVAWKLSLLEKGQPVHSGSDLVGRSILSKDLKTFVHAKENGVQIWDLRLE